MKFSVTKIGRLPPMSDDRFYFIVLCVLAAVVGGVALTFALTMHRNFLTIACDTAAYENAVVNSMHGNWFRDSAYDGPNILGQHSMFVLLLLVPIYALFPTPDTLFSLQVIGVYSAVIPLYLVTVELLKQPVAGFLVAFSAMVSPFLLHLALSPFHPETWFLPAVLWAYLFYLRDWPVGYGVTVAIALCCGEQVAFFFMLLGVSLLLFKDSRAWSKRYGWWSLGFGAGWLAFTTGVLFPLMHSPAQPNVVAYHYPQWNATSVPGLVAAAAHQPALALEFMSSPARWIHVVGMVGPTLILAFLSWRTLILLGSFPLYWLMSDQEFFLYFHAYYFFYIFFAGYLALIFMLMRAPGLGRSAAVLLAGLTLGNVILLCCVVSFYTQFGNASDQKFSDTLHEVFARIPTNEAVYTPHRYSAYLADRPDVVMGDLRGPHADFDTLVEAKYPQTNVHASQIHFIVCDLITDQCGFRQGGFNQEASNGRADNVNRLLQSKRWQVFWAGNDLYVLKRVEK